MENTDDKPQIKDKDIKDLSPEDLLNKEVVKKMALSLDNMCLILEQAFKTLMNIDNANLILAIGNTGCGKSTMMTSLMFGSDALEIKKVTQTIEVP